MPMNAPIAIAPSGASIFQEEKSAPLPLPVSSQTESPMLPATTKSSRTQTTLLMGGGVPGKAVPSRNTDPRLT